MDGPLMYGDDEFDEFYDDDLSGYRPWPRWIRVAALVLLFCFVGIPLISLLFGRYLFG